MKQGKIIVLISSVLGIIIGVAILILAIMDIDAPKLIWAIFAVVNFVNAIVNIINYKKIKK